MPTQTKIEKYGLEEEVLAMRKAGLSYSAIAKELKRRYPEIEDLKDINKMSIKRFLEKYLTKEYEEKLERGESPVRDIYTEFKEKMRKLIARTEEQNLKIEGLLDKALEEKDYDLMLRVLREIRENYKEIRQQMTALIQYGEERIRPLVNINVKKELKINNMLLMFASNLCPKCKAKVSTILAEYGGR